MFKTVEYGLSQLEGVGPECPRVLSGLSAFNTVEVTGLLHTFQLMLQQQLGNPAPCHQRQQAEQCTLAVWTDGNTFKVVWDLTTCTR